MYRETPRVLFKKELILVLELEGSTDQDYLTYSTYQRYNQLQQQTLRVPLIEVWLCFLNPSAFSLYLYKSAGNWHFVAFVVFWLKYFELITNWNIVCWSDLLQSGVPTINNISEHVKSLRINMVTFVCQRWWSSTWSLYYNINKCITGVISK